MPSHPIVVRMREDWLTEIKLPDEDDPIVLVPGDEVEITPRAEVVVHRQRPAASAATSSGKGKMRCIQDETV